MKYYYSKTCLFRIYSILFESKSLRIKINRIKSHKDFSLYSKNIPNQKL